MTAIERLRDKKLCSNFLKLFDLLFVAWFYSFMTIAYYAATTDIIDTIIYPDNEVIRYSITFSITYAVLFVFYVFQNEIQRVHDWLARRKCCAARKPKSPLPTQQATESSPDVSDRCCYYDFAFFFRCFYGYIVGVAYTTQWHVFWGVFLLLTGNVHWGYMVLVSFVAIVIYRVVLKMPMVVYCQTVPFNLVRDKSFKGYFDQFYFIKLKKHIKLDHFANFVYFEFILMFIALFSWFGISVMFLTGLTEGLQGVVDDPAGVELLIALGISYAIFIILFSYQYLVNKFKIGCCCIKVWYIKELVYFIAFIGVIITWHAIWDGYDYLVGESPYKLHIYVATHFGTFLVVFFGQVGTSLYGPRGLIVSFDVYTPSNKNQSVKAYLAEYSRMDFFDIKYFSKGSASPLKKKLQTEQGISSLGADPYSL